MEIVPYLRTTLLYIFAGLVWGWLRNEKSPLWGLFGGAILFVYGVIPTLQTEPAFGRVYAAYGGIFIVLSILWGRIVDGWQPDRFDLIGAGIALVGVAVIIWGRNWFP